MAWEKYTASCRVLAMGAAVVCRAESLARGENSRSARTSPAAAAAAAVSTDLGPTQRRASRPVASRTSTRYVCSCRYP